MQRNGKINLVGTKSKHCKLEGGSIEAKGLKFEKNKKYQISAQIQHLEIKAALIDISINFHYIDIKR